MNTTPTQVDGELYESAKVVAALMGRSAAQQIAHWARIGREVEAVASVSQPSIAAALAGVVPYDELTPLEQAVVRAEWVERMDALRENLDFSAEFAAVGKTYVGLDAQDQVVRYGSDGTLREGVSSGAAGV